MTDVRGGRFLNLLRTALLVISGTVVALLAIEGIFRLAPTSFSGREWRQGGSHPRGLVRPDPELGYSLTPGFTGRDVNIFGDFDIPVEINEDGLRDRPGSGEGCDPTIIGLGDSVTFGEGVTMEKSWLALLEQALRQDDARACVIKGGVPGYGLHQISGYYDRLARRHPHRLALVGLLNYDLLRIQRGFTEYDGWIVFEPYLPLLQRCGNGDVHIRKAVLNPMHHFLTCNSRAYGWLMARSLPGGGTTPLGTVLLPDLELPASARTAGGTPEEYFLRMKGVGTRSDAGLLVIALCFDDPALAGFLLANGIDYLSIPCEQSWFFPHDEHFNEAGHKATAVRIASHLGIDPVAIK